MKKIAAVLLISVCAAASAKEVVSVGTGTTIEAATLNAKKEATAQVAGSFIVGRTDVTNNEVEQRIFEYNGGFVRSYSVVNTVNEDGLFKVTIKADVDEDKINTVVFSTGKDVDPKEISKLANAQESSEKLEDILQTLLSDPNKMATKISSTSYEVNGAKTRVLIDYSVGWSPKWVDDLHTIAKKASPELGLMENRSFGVCFMSKGLVFTSSDCRDMHFGLSLPEQVYANVYAIDKFGKKTYVVNAVIAVSALHRNGQYDSRQQGMFVYTNGHVSGQIDVVVDTSMLRDVKSFSIELQ